METSVDALADLEEKVQRAVELVSSLRAERDAARAELAQLRKSSGASEAESDKLRAELLSLRGERTQVRTRIEKLLGQLDLLSES